jgi:cytochrome P450
VIGVELQNLNSSSSALNFRECYDRMLNQSTLSGIITFIHVNIPIRRFLPIEANTGFVRASQEIRRILREVIRDRVKAVHGIKAEGEVPLIDSESRMHTGQDILTYMIEERFSGDDAWTEDQIMEHVSLLFVLTSYKVLTRSNSY